MLTVLLMPRLAMSPAPPTHHYHTRVSLDGYPFPGTGRTTRMRSPTCLLVHACHQQGILLRASAGIRCSSQTSKHRDSQDQVDINKQTISNGFSPMASDKSKGKQPAVPRPSASVLLVSPQNQILLLQRVKQSSSFASAHVFPGGNVSEFHDGKMPGPDSEDRHMDSEIYRLAAIRETFEESGILLARNAGFGRLIEVPEAEREEGRREIHSNETSFQQWLAKKGGRADTGKFKDRISERGC